MMNIYITHFRKIFYIILFSSAVWFISFSIFPENQVIKIEVGDVSPVSFSAPRFLSVVDEQETQKLKEDARNNVAPVYSIDTKINVSVIDGITEMFLTIIKARTEEVLVTDNETNPENPQSIVETQELSKVEQIEKVQSSLLFSTISTSAVEVLVEISNFDNLNSSNFLTQIEFEAKSQADILLINGINNENLNQIRQTIVQTPPNLNLPSELYVLVPEARVRSMVGEIIAENLIANQKLEEELWNEQKNKVSDAVEVVTVQFFKDEIIVNEGEIIDEALYKALDEFGYLSGESRTVQTSAIPIIFSVFLVLYVLLWRLRDSIWKNDNELLLMLTLILVSSIFLRGVSYYSNLSDLDFIQYALPVSFVGVISVILLNLRATLILSLSSSLLALAGGGNIGLVALGALGTIIPAVFLSEDTDRSLLRERNIYIRALEREYSAANLEFPLLNPSNGIISSEYGVKRFINNVQRNPHLGLDIAANIGEPVYASADGIVLLSDEFFYKGNFVLLGHGNNFKTSYSHLNESFVTENEIVKKGQLIGLVGKSGRVTGPHLHFEVIFLNKKLNPELFIQ